ncbi:phospholipase D family protein [Tessaracoccus antarcticus]|uniref:PLD phosphodiesterase domain-containing protein n=1 Tax=Tessaracoccus antarcticus TaxID=2479848 RepID=A0A3M0GWH7_9ACTN|nr:phospholipase D family protein [Tessaracoccus antarcticus]RMB61706.1 hypothetical protein EAX62_03510 [Tessaracoccus antarcticus]
MLAPDSRVVLLEQLRPPVGYQLEAAVATTFTLQLGAALVPPLAFASHEIRGGTDPLSVLESVRSASDRIDIYCQAGQIAVPKRASDLMAFLEPMVHPVRPPKAGFLFHPKIWFVHYTAKAQPDRYRLLCLTRNLVDSQAWDAAVVLDGVDGVDATEANLPLAAFLRNLPELAVNRSERRARRARDLAERATRVRWSNPDGVQGLRFHAMGVPGVADTTDFTGLRHLVISPFCDAAGVAHVTGGGRDAIVVSRAEAMDSLDPGWLSRLRLGGKDGSVFVLDPLAVPPGEQAAALGGAADPAAGTSGEAARELGELTGLHAKVIVIEKNWKAHLFIGSANATSAAFNGNVEFMVEMWGRALDLGYRTMMDPGLKKGQRNFRDLLQPYVTGETRVSEEDVELRRLRNLLRRLAAVPYRMTVQDGRSHYDLQLTSEGAVVLPEEHALAFGLLTRPGVAHTHAAETRVDAVFDEVPLADITPFVVLRLTGPDGTVADTVVHAPLVNDPEDRLDAVLARQVDTREKFLRFLALVLGLADSSALAAMAGDIATSGAGWEAGGGGHAGIFEIVVEAMADRPESIRELDRLVKRLGQTAEGRELFPEGFEELWTNVELALGQVRRQP